MDARPDAADPDVIERLAFDAWPAAEVEERDGWRLRFNRGVTNRASSVWPNAAWGSADLAERIARAEAFYHARGAPALFQLSPAARPDGLEAALAARGYAVHAPVAVQVAAARDVTARCAVPTHLRVEVSERLGEDWFGLSGRRGRFAGEAVAVYRRLLERVRDRPGFALARAGGVPVGVALGVAQAGWVGVSSMLVLPEARRRGAGGALLGALAAWALRIGAGRLYLQVETHNAAALRLYAGAGFATAYGYHYRREPEARGAERRASPRGPRRKRTR
jgi:GNAT superfamily N-acetyltransferase